MITSVGLVNTQAKTSSDEGWPSRLEASGSHFELVSSSYLPITIDSSEPVKLMLDSVGGMVWMYLEAVSQASSAELKVSGFIPGTTYHKYEDNYHNHQEFTADSSGKYTYVQDLSKPHFVFIQTKESTKFIIDDATGGDCTAIGVWDNPSKTCTLSTDLAETVEIDSDGITLDGNGHSITGSGTGFGVHLNIKNFVTVKNLNITNFTNGINLAFANNNHITANSISGNGDNGIFSLFSRNNTYDANSLFANSNWGINLVAFSNSNDIFDNLVENNGNGLALFSSSSNVLTGNTIRQNGGFGINLFNSSNNLIYRNNFIDNLTQVTVTGLGNAFNLSLPTGGNYWNDFDSPQEGCENLNGDKFCDAPYAFSNGQDDYPWTIASGWLAPTYVFSGVLPPIKPDGTGVFNLGRVIPLKFQLLDGIGNFVDSANAKLYLAEITDSVVGPETEAVSVSSSNVGNVFRYDPDENVYIFNLKTKDLSTGKWRLRIALDDGTWKYLVIALVSS